ncbi:hypothetical protein QE152_g40910, partial [Popillia japonica]
CNPEIDVIVFLLQS